MSMLNLNKKIKEGAFSFSGMVNCPHLFTSKIASGMLDNSVTMALTVLSSYTSFQMCMTILMTEIFLAVTVHKNVLK